jgi:hypothetical protein
MPRRAPRCAEIPRRRPSIVGSAIAVGALGLWLAPAAALEPPSVVRLLTGASDDGTFVVDLGGLACSGRDQLSITLDKAPVQRVAQAGCTLALAPAHALAAGKHCVNVKADFFVDFEESCFEVTGTRPDLSVAGVELSATTTPDGLADTNCEPCAGLSSGACTRWNPTRHVEAALRAPPELASRYAFALLQRFGSEPPLPEEIDFGLYGSRVGHGLTLVQREAGAPLCITAFARAFGTSLVQVIGEGCMPAVEPSSVPASFRELECAGYTQRWCIDNRSDCEADPGLIGCASYAQVCEGAPALDASAQTTAAPSAQGEAGSADAAAPDDLDPPDARGRSSHRGCQLGGAHAPDGVFALWFAFGLVANSRKRRLR